MDMNASHGLKSIVALCLAVAAFAANAQALPGMVTVKAADGFAATEQRLEQAIAANGMGLVARASASSGAAARGVKIPGNAVLMVFRNDYAVRMLAASLPAGIGAAAHLPDGKPGRQRDDRLPPAERRVRALRQRRARRDGEGARPGVRQGRA
jgi:hypothetical protein